MCIGSEDELSGKNLTFIYRLFVPPSYSSLSSVASTRDAFSPNAICIFSRITVIRGGLSRFGISSDERKRDGEAVRVLLEIKRQISPVLLSSLRTFVWLVCLLGRGGRFLHPITYGELKPRHVLHLPALSTNYRSVEDSD